MPEITIRIASRPYVVACQAGEEHFLQAAADLLDKEASGLKSQMENLPENRLLLMSGLILADKISAGRTDGMSGEVNTLNAKIHRLEKELQDAKNSTIEAEKNVERIVKVFSEVTEFTETLAERLDNNMMPATS